MAGPTTGEYSARNAELRCWCRSPRASSARTRHATRRRRERHPQQRRRRDRGQLRRGRGHRGKRQHGAGGNRRNAPPPCHRRDDTTFALKPPACAATAPAWRGCPCVLLLSREADPPRQRLAAHHIRQRPHQQQPTRGRGQFKPSRPALDVQSVRAAGGGRRRTRCVRRGARGSVRAIPTSRQAEMLVPSSKEGGVDLVDRRPGVSDLPAVGAGCRIRREEPKCRGGRQDSHDAEVPHLPDVHASPRAERREPVVLRRPRF